MPGVAPAPHPGGGFGAEMTVTPAGWLAAPRVFARARQKRALDSPGIDPGDFDPKAPGSGRSGHVLGVLFDLNQRVIALVRSDMEIG